MKMATLITIMLMGIIILSTTLLAQIFDPLQRKSLDPVISPQKAKEYSDLITYEAKVTDLLRQLERAVLYSEIKKLKIDKEKISFESIQKSMSQLYQELKIEEPSEVAPLSVTLPLLGQPSPNPPILGPNFPHPGPPTLQEKDIDSISSISKYNMGVSASLKWQLATY